LVSLIPYRWRTAAVVGAHAALLAGCYYFSFLLRFDFRIPEPYVPGFLWTLPIVLAARVAALYVFKLHRGLWRFSSVSDLLGLVRAVTLSSAVILAAIVFTRGSHGFPRSVLIIDFGLTLLVLGGLRLGSRVFSESLGSVRSARHRTPTMIVGAGNAADRLLRDIRRNPDATISPVALVDDDPQKHGLSLHGVPVVGAIDEIADLAYRYQAKLIVIAVPSASKAEMLRLVQRCVDAGVRFKIMPSLPELLDGGARPTQIRDVGIEDLLGRDAVQLDLAPARRELAGKVVLITGGAGSIGSELARQVAALHPARLVLLEQAESPLYFIHLEIAKRFPGVEVVPVIADVVNQARIDEVFAAHKPHCVFHAAAYKHVPMMEHNVIEAVRNNVFGTWCVAHHAARHGAERFVLISTDKAVRPSSVMGATKRIAERVVLGTPALRDAATDFRAVRFGNVLGSDGSVIPLFKRQLQAGGPLTVTHPDVTRYFMTIPEASQLVLLAATLPEAAGRISMLEMGQPVKIVNLAENLIRLSGLEPGRDINIEFTGLRPGEKLHEELMSDVEATVPTMVEKVRIVQTDEPEGRLLAARLDDLASSVEVGGDHDVLAAICGLVPECVSPLQDRGVEAMTRRVELTGFDAGEGRPGSRMSWPPALVPAAKRPPASRAGLPAREST
jgi:FlaA1/EpsC-like NDP-sugar epimerase